MGKQHVLFNAQRADRTPAANVQFVLDWPGRDRDTAPAYATTDGTGQAGIPMWASMDPNLKNGIYFGSARAEPSDTVSGMGLPNNQKVNFVLTFKYG